MLASGVVVIEGSVRGGWRLSIKLCHLEVVFPAEPLLGGTDGVIGLSINNVWNAG